MKTIERFFRFGQHKLAGVLHSPSLETTACVVTSHGFFSNKDSGKYKDIARGFCEKGMAVFRFDFRGFGESEGITEEITLTGRIQDLQAAMNLITEEGFKKIGIIGSSLGGYVSILTAAKDRRIKALATWATPIYLSELFSNKTVWKFQKFLNDMKNHDVTSSLRDIGCPIIIIHGSCDEQVPILHAKTMHRKAKQPKKLHIIKGADHRFTNTLHRRRAIELTLKWFKDYLGKS